MSPRSKKKISSELVKSACVYKNVIYIFIYLLNKSYAYIMGNSSDWISIIISGDIYTVLFTF